MRGRRLPSALARPWLVGALAVVLTLAGGSVGAQAAADEALRARVAAAIAGAADLPENAFSVSVRDGVVSIAGSVVCEDCGGMQTPGGIQSVQQTLGAVVRAVPGVQRVEFDLAYESGS